MAISSEQEASLVCFGEPPANLELTVAARREGGKVQLDYRLSGALQGLRLPLSAAAERRDGLWESTCFEAFVSESLQPFYWELNASPALHWNLYHFRDYRAGRKIEARIPAPRIEVPSRGQDFFQMKVGLDLSRVIGAQTPIDVGLTAVIESEDGSKTYWAVKHLGAQPDFHLRRAFQLRL